MVLEVKNPPASARHNETWVRSLGQQDSLEKDMATHSSILAWRAPWTEEPGGLLSMGSHRVGHNRSDLAAGAHLKQLEKEERKNNRVSRRKEIIKIRAEINEKETKETIEEMKKKKKLKAGSLRR